MNSWLILTFWGMSGYKSLGSRNSTQWVPAASEWENFYQCIAMGWLQFWLDKNQTKTKQKRKTPHITHLRTKVVKQFMAHTLNPVLLRQAECSWMSTGVVPVWGALQGCFGVMRLIMDCAARKQVIINNPSWLSDHLSGIFGPFHRAWPCHLCHDWWQDSQSFFLYLWPNVASLYVAGM